LETVASRGDPERALIDAAVAIVAEGGLAEVNLPDLEMRAGLAKEAAAAHFATKQALLAAAAVEGFRILREEFVEALKTRGEDPLDRWEAIGIAYVRFAVRHPGYFRIMYDSNLSSHETFPALDKAARDAFHVLIEAVAASQAAKRVPHGEARDLAFISWAMMHGVADLLLNRQFARLSENVVQAEAAALAAARVLRMGLEEGRAESAQTPSKPR
jgi:AcrR family transcriptional regulator